MEKVDFARVDGRGGLNLESGRGECERVVGGVVDEAFVGQVFFKVGFDVNVEIAGEVAKGRDD